MENDGCQKQNLSSERTILTDSAETIPIPLKEEVEIEVKVDAGINENDTGRAPKKIECKKQQLQQNQEDDFTKEIVQEAINCLINRIDLNFSEIEIEDKGEEQEQEIEHEQTQAALVSESHQHHQHHEQEFDNRASDLDFQDKELFAISTGELERQEEGDHVLSLKDDVVNRKGEEKEGQGGEGYEDQTNSCAKEHQKAFYHATKEEILYHKIKSKLFFQKHLVIWLVFLFAAAVVGLVASAFALCISPASTALRPYIEQYPAIAFAVAPVGFTLIYLLVEFFFWGVSGSGIPLQIAMLEGLEVLEKGDAQQQLDGPDILNKKSIDFSRSSTHELDQVFGENIRLVLSWRIAIGKFGLTILGIVFGASIGREGPTVHISSCILYGILRLGFRASSIVRNEVLKNHASRIAYIKATSLSGGSAGIASAFNAPLGGVIFAIEEMGGCFDPALGRLILTTVVIAGTVTILLEGSYRYFGVVDVDATPAMSVVVAIIVSLIAGLLGGLWGFSLYFLLKLKKCLPIWRDNAIVFCFVFSFLFACVGYASNGSVYGSGYREARTILDGYVYCLTDNEHGIFYINGTQYYATEASYGFSKGLATLLVYLTGIPGGIFSPMLSSGAGWGALLYCEVFRHIYSDVSPGLIALFTMQAYFAAVTQSPLTAYTILTAMVTVNESANLIFLEVARLIIAVLAASVSRIIMPRGLYGSIAALGTARIPNKCLAPDIQHLKEKQKAKENEVDQNKHLLPRISLFSEESWY